MPDLVGLLLFAAIPTALSLAWKYLLKGPVRRLYSPPTGGWLLFGTWGLALSLIPFAYGWRFRHPYLGMAIVILSIPTALFLTLVFRDQRHIVAGRDLAAEIIPQRLGIASRLVWGGLSLVTAAITLYLMMTPTRQWDVLLSLGPLSVTLAGIAWKGTVPQHVRESLGAPTDGPSRLDAG